MWGDFFSFLFIMFINPQTSKKLPPAFKNILLYSTNVLPFNSVFLSSAKHTTFETCCYFQTVILINNKTQNYF